MRQSFLSPACAGRRAPQPEPKRAVRLLPGKRFAEAKPARRQLPCFVLHRGRFILPRLLPVGRWALTPPFHPYRKRHEAPPGGLFSVTLSVMPCFRMAFPQILCGPLSSGVRTFLPQANCGRLPIVHLTSSAAFHCGKEENGGVASLAPVVSLRSPSAAKRVLNRMPASRVSASCASSSHCSFLPQQSLPRRSHRFRLGDPPCSCPFRRMRRRNCETTIVCE